MSVKKAPLDKWRVTTEVDSDIILRIREDCVLKRISQKQLICDIITAYYSQSKILWKKGVKK